MSQACNILLGKWHKCQRKNGACSLIPLLSTSLLLFFSSDLVLLVVGCLLVPAGTKSHDNCSTFRWQACLHAPFSSTDMLPSPLQTIAHLGNVEADVVALGFGFAFACNMGMFGQVGDSHSPLVTQGTQQTDECLHLVYTVS